MLKVTIGTPSQGTVKTAYVDTLLATIKDLTAHGMQWSYLAQEGSDLVFQRNWLASRFLEVQGATHLFLVDSDMHVDGSLCRTLLSFDKPMIGCAYSTKHPNAGKRYWHAYLADGAAVERGAARCEGVAFGATLIRRDVLETMIERGAAKPQRWLDEQFYNFFGDRPADAAEGVHTAEDVSFCRRWRIDCGGEIWAYLDARIGHIGDYAYGADQSYLDWLKEKGAFTPQGV